MHAAGILGHVAADRTGDLRRRIGGVVQVKGGCRLGDRQVAHAGLHPGEAALGIDFENGLQTGQHQQHAAFQRQGAAGQTGTGAAGDNRDLALMADLHEGLDLLNGLGNHHQQRHDTVGRQPIAFIGLQVFTLVQHFQIRQCLAQLADQSRLVHGRQRAVELFIIEKVHGYHLFAIEGLWTSLWPRILLLWAADVQPKTIWYDQFVALILQILCAKACEIQVFTKI